LTMAKKKKSKRTVMYSSGGKKLYAVRDAKGEFEDIQTYKRAQGQDEKRKSKAELEAAAKKKTTKKKPVKKKAKKKVKK
jgi:DNA-binding protein HU-beta